MLSNQTDKGFGFRPRKELQGCLGQWGHTSGEGKRFPGLSEGAVPPNTAKPLGPLNGPKSRRFNRPYTVEFHSIWVQNLGPNAQGLIFC